MASVFRRTSLEVFTLANDAYRNAVVTFYKADEETGVSTETLATLYSSYAGSDTVANPVTLNSSGRLSAPVYIDVPVIATITESDVENHSTGAIFPEGGTYKNDWAAGTSYTPGDIVKDGSAGANTGNYYIAAIAHESGTTWTTDLGAGKFSLFLEVEDVLDAKTDAETAATAAAASQTAAATSATNASTSASAASTSETNAGTSATSASTSATAAAASATAAAASAASVNIDTPVASKHGALVYQNDDDDGFDLLTTQGSSGNVLQSGGADAAPSWVSNVTINRSSVAASGNVNFSTTHTDRFVRYTGSGGNTWTIDPDSTTDLPTNTEIEIFNAGTGSLTLTAGTGVTVNGVTAGSVTIPQYSAGCIKKSAANAWDYIGVDADLWA